MDLLVTNGFIPTAPFLANDIAQLNRLFLNNGQGDFTQSNLQGSSAWGRGMAISDIDLDGDLDYLVVNNNASFFLNAADEVQLFRNESNGAHHWVDFILENEDGTQGGLGAKLFLHQAGKTQYQESLGGQGGHASQSSSTMHFGLGTNNRIDSLIIIWPDGEKQIESDLEINKTHRIKRKRLISSNPTKSPNALSDLKIYPNPFSNSTTISFKLTKPEHVTIEIFNLLGQWVQDYTLGKQKTVNHQINITKPGTYLIKIVTQTTSYNQKMVNTNQ